MWYEDERIDIILFMILVLLLPIIVGGLVMEVNEPVLDFPRIAFKVATILVVLHSALGVYNRNRSKQ